MPAPPLDLLPAPRSMSLSPRLVALLTAAPLLWAGNAIVGRIAVTASPPLALNAMRWAVTLCVLLLLGWRAIATPARRRDVLQRWRYLALLGLLGTGAYNALQYMALVTSGPINVTLIGASMPMWTMLIGALFFGTRPRLAQAVGAVCSLLGVAVVLSRGHLATLAELRLVPGDLLMLAATGCWAGYSWLLAKAPASMQGAQRPQIDTADGGQRPWNWAEFLMVQTMFGLAWAGAAAGLEQWVAPRAIVWHPWLLAALAYVALGASVLAYWFWGEGVALGGAPLASFFINFIPVFAALLSTLLLGEAPHAYHGIAFGLIVLGIWITSRR